MAFTIAFNEVGGFWDVFQDGKRIGRGFAPIDAIRSATSGPDGASITSFDRSELLSSAADQEEQRQARERERTQAAQQSAAAATDSQKVLDDPTIRTATETSAASDKLNPDEKKRLDETANGRAAVQRESTAQTESGRSQSDNNEPSATVQRQTGIATSSSSVPANQKAKAGRPNPLDSYANYTYGLSLHIIPKDVYNSVANGGTEYVPRNTVLIASGGRSGEKFSFLEYFNKADFYIERLQLNTVVGLNSRSRSSNVVDLTFTVVEPIGMTLLNRLLLTAKKFNFFNWGQMPFMLQIDFFGNSDSGQAVKIDSQTKYLPIKIIDCKIKVGTKGSEYNFSAVPFSHQAFLESAASTPASFEVHADSVGNFFNYESGSDPSAASGTFAQRNAIETKINQFEDRSRDVIGEGGGSDVRIGRIGLQNARQERSDLLGNKTAWRVNSYAAALNSNQRQLVERKWQTIADEIYFDIHPDIAKAKLVFPDQNPTRTSSIKKSNEIEARRATLGPGSASIQTKDQALTINAGTSIIDVINFVIRNSEYITKQVQTEKESKASDSNSGPVKWFKVTCKVELLNYDHKRNVQGKKYTYYIRPYEYYNTKYPEAPKAIPNTWEKEYNYSYTGKNQSIIDFDLDFNAMFFTAMTAMREAKASFEPGPDDEAADPDSPNTSSKDKTRNTVSPLQIRPTTFHGTTQLVGGRNDNDNASANDLYNSIMTNSRGDMINVKLKIAGDPEFIKQDDLYFNPSTQSKEVSIDANNGSLIMDASEIFANLKFRIPTDINQTTGLMTFDTRNAAGEIIGDNVFNGIYKIVTVENSFERGNFTQNLDLVRLFGQEQTAQKDSNRQGENETSEEADAEEVGLELLNDSRVEYEPSQYATLGEPLIEMESPRPAPVVADAETVIKSQIEKLRDTVATAGESNIAENSNNQGESWVFDGYRG